MSFSQIKVRQWIADGRWIEPLLALIVLGGLIRVGINLYYEGYLLQPFFYDVSDTWMDWFNTAAWAKDPGRYDTWGSLYPPLTFVLLNIFRTPGCYADWGGFFVGYARSCDWIGVAALHGFYLLNIVLISAVFLKTNRSTALPRAFALAAGLPMLTAMERGNVMILCFTAFLLAYGPLMRSARLRWLAVAFTINFKIYLIACIFPQLIKRRWRWFEGALIATVVVYLVTYLTLGTGTPAQIYENVVAYGESGSYQPLDLWAAVSYKPMIGLLNSFPLSGFIGSRLVDFLAIAVPWFILITQLIILFTMVMAWLRPEVVPMYRLTNLGVLFVLITQETGGYTPIFFIFLTFMEPWKGVGRKIAIVTSYIICFEFDFIIDRILTTWNESFLVGHPVFQTYYLMVGFFIRPAFNHLIALSLAAVTIREIWIDIRVQGWKDRWRFRNDASLLRGEGTARQPV